MADVPLRNYSLTHPGHTKPTHVVSTGFDFQQRSKPYICLMPGIISAQ